MKWAITNKITHHKYKKNAHTSVVYFILVLYTAATD